jgi:hypothetical protein
MSDRCTTLSGSIDVPTLVPQPVVGLPFKNRLMDHFGAGRNIDSQAFEFFQQVSRSENASPVADLGVKPTTTLAMQAVSGYAYFLATVTELRRCVCFGISRRWWIGCTPSSTG